MCKSSENILQQPICSESCGDAIRSSQEECDNGNKAGCSKNCVPDPNHRCYGPIGSSSYCQKDTICGDGIIDVGQQCDTGNRTGCSQRCRVDIGYKCTKQIGKQSLCSLCGNGILQYGEQCDNQNQIGCSQNGKIDSGFDCRTGSPSLCLKKNPICGNGVIEIAEMCDDGNREVGDGCNQFCRIQFGFDCTGELAQRSSCQKIQVPVSVCGNSVFEPFPSTAGFIQQCDNGNQKGCKLCVIQNGFFCTSSVGRQSFCFPVAAPSCGNSILESREQCDDGNTLNGDGCNYFCQVQFGWTCRGVLGCIRNVITPLKAAFCGNGKVEEGEQCDDGFPIVSGDGCNSRCRKEVGWTCEIVEELSKCRRSTK